MKSFAAAFAILLSGWAAPAIAELPPLQCLHRGSGMAYEVGPGQAYAAIGEVPWESLNAGDTVRIHYRAEPYREKILIRRQGTQAQPIVVCGVAGPGGELPILDGENATTRPTMGYRPTNGAGEVHGLIHVSWSATDFFGFKPQHIVIQGLHIRHALHEYSFTASTGAKMNYSTNAAGIYVERGEHITVRGVILEGNGNGFFVASGDSEEVLSRDIVLERSRLSGNGTVTMASERHHNVYTEAAGTLIRHNEIGPLRPGSAGSARHAAKGGVAHPWQFLGKGPDAYDDGQQSACTGIAGTAPRVWCVRAGAAAGGIGTAAAPLASINAAIAVAAAGDIVQVAAGTYAENVTLGSFAIPSAKHLTLRGGFNADFSQRNAGLNRSVINGGGVAPAVQLHVDSIGTTTLDGFELVNGRGLGSDFSDGGGRGGGVFARQFGNGVMLLSHNEIHDNVTANFGDEARGGGIHTYNPPLVDGGGTGVMRIEDNYVHDNRAGRGAGINVTGIQARVLRNRIENNLGQSDHGGGLYVSTVDTEVKDNAIHGNEIGVAVGYGWGGGAIVAGANADFEGNVITNNFAPSIGSGMFWDEGATGTHRNDLFFGNRCTNDGRQGTAIYVDGGDPGPSIVNLHHVTIAHHDCPGTSATGGAIFLEALSQAHLRNSILWGNTREFGDDGTAVMYSVVHSTSAEPGVGNALADPLFANPATGDYHLRSIGGRFTPAGFVVDAVTSPAIDAGDPAADFSRETMPNGGRVNRGAYGNTAEASRSVANDTIFENGFE